MFACPPPPPFSKLRGKALKLTAAIESHPPPKGNNTAPHLESHDKRAYPFNFEEGGAGEVSSGALTILYDINFARWCSIVSFDGRPHTAFPLEHDGPAS